MIGYRFTRFDETTNKAKSTFDNLLKVFLQLLTISSGDVNEALNWMNEIDRRYKLTDNNYGMADFIEDLKNQNYIRQDDATSQFIPTNKSERTIRKQSLEEIFGKIKKNFKGNHKHLLPDKVTSKPQKKGSICLAILQNKLI